MGGAPELGFVWKANPFISPGKAQLSLMGKAKSITYSSTPINFELACPAPPIAIYESNPYRCEQYQAPS